MRVKQLADWYGVSTTFLVRALARIGVADAQPDTVLPTDVLTRFEAAFGTKIREAQARQRMFTSWPMDRKPERHVMRVAHGKVGAGRDAHRNRVKMLLEDPGIVHAIDAAGTYDGDPWRGAVQSGDVHFFGGAINSGPPAACGQQHMRAVLSQEFVPADDPISAGQCQRCAAIVADGQGFRTPPDERYRSYFCDSYLRLRIDGEVTVKNCTLRDFHGGSHRARDGAEWTIGPGDYVPAPNEVGCHITEAS